VQLNCSVSLPTVWGADVGVLVWGWPWVSQGVVAPGVCCWDERDAHGF